MSAVISSASDILPRFNRERMLHRISATRPRADRIEHAEETLSKLLDYSIHDLTDRPERFLLAVEDVDDFDLAEGLKAARTLLKAHRAQHAVTLYLAACDKTAQAWKHTLHNRDRYRAARRLVWAFESRVRVRMWHHKDALAALRKAGV